MVQPTSFHVTVMTAQDAFYECKEWCFYALKAAGYEVSYADNQLRPDAINIVLGSYCTPDTWRSLSAQAKHIIIYNWEPAASDHGRFTQRYIRCLHNAHVWDYSRNNVQELREYAGVQDIHYVPMGYVPTMQHVLPAPEQDIDVLFYGTMYPRRQGVINTLRAKGLNVVTSDDYAGQITGSLRDELLARAKVVLNIHAFDGVHVFEMARISYLLANSKAVVAEVSERTDIDDDLQDAVVHGSIDMLPQLCWDLVQNVEQRRALELRAHKLFAARDAASIMRTAVERYLQQIQTTPKCVGNTQPVALSLPTVLQIGSGSIGQGFNERWNYRRCNIDERVDFAPDIVLDMNKPLPFDTVLETTRFGKIVLKQGYFSKIAAQQLFQRSTNIVQALNNCMNLLQDGGVLEIPVWLEFSHKAWSHVHDRRTFSEQSWLRICEDWWQYGWRTHRFEPIAVNSSVDNLFGYDILRNNGGDWEAALKIPRAIETQTVVLRKRVLTEDEKRQLPQIRFID